MAQYRTGVYQPGDKLIAGVTLYLYGSDGAPIFDFSTGQQMSATTDANGFYEFTDLPGNQLYSVAEEPLSEQPEVASNSANGENDRARPDGGRHDRRRCRQIRATRSISKRSSPWAEPRFDRGRRKFRWRSAARRRTTTSAWW